MTNQNRSNLEGGHPTTKTPKDLTGDLPPLINAASVIGRQSDLDRLGDALKDTAQVALVNGLGGIGKSTLAKLYITENYDSLDHIAWLSFTGKSFEEMVTSSLLAESLGLDRQNTPPDKLLPLIFQQLKELSGKNLLVIDNADHTEEISKYRHKLPQGLDNWQVLITSRGVIEGFRQIPIDTLSLEDAKTLFLTHCPKGNDETEALEKLLDLVGLHTLTIELMAKTLAKSRQLKSVAELLEKIKDKKYEDPTLLKEVWVAHKDKWHNEEEKRTIKGIYQYLLATFDLAELNGNEHWLLKQFAVLPPKPLEVEVFFEWLGLNKENAENATEVEDTLESLIAKGWLQESEDGGSVLLHAVLKELVLFKLKPRFEDCKILIKGFTKFIDVEYDPQSLAKKLHFLEQGDSIIQVFSKNIKPNNYSHSTEEIFVLAYFYDRVASLYRTKGVYSKALEIGHISLTLVDKSNSVSIMAEVYATLLTSLTNEQKISIEELNIIEQSSIAKEVATALFQHNMATTHQELGNHKIAKELLELSLKSNLKNFGEQHPKVAVGKMQLAKTYTVFGDFIKAKELLKSALSITISHDNKHPSVLNTVHSSLGILMAGLGEHSRAIELLTLAYEASIELLGKNHPYTTSIQANLAFYYENKGDYQKAKELLSETLTSDLITFGKNHECIARHYNGLGIIYTKEGKVEEAKKCFQKAYKIRVKVYDENHPYVKDVVKSLAKLKK